MQTVLAYSKVQSISASEEELLALTDQTMPITNNHFLLPKPLNLLYAAAIGATISVAKLESPSLRYPAPPYLDALIASVDLPSDPNINDYRTNPLRIPMQEELVVKASNSDGAATKRATVVLFLEDQPTPVPQGGQVFTVRATGAIAGVAYSWQSGNLTFGSQLPQGRYAIVGMQAQGATLLAARLIFPDGPTFRPGVLGITAIGNRQPFAGRKGAGGMLGSFLNTVPPLLEVLCRTTDATQEVYFDLVKIG